MKVYIIAGKAGCGKNTTANYIKDYYETLGKKSAITEISKYFYKKWVLQLGMKYIMMIF